VANLFGDRWNYLQVCGYLWVIAGMVAHALKLEEGAAETEVPAGAEVIEPPVEVLA
jgi:hypothetical protein